MGCTSEATLSVSGGLLIRQERNYVRGRLATETLSVERMAGALTAAQAAR